MDNHQLITYISVHLAVRRVDELAYQQIYNSKTQQEEYNYD